MGPITATHYIGLSAILFAIGAVGVGIKRNPIVIFMCIELMLNAANLALVAMGKHLGSISGQMMAVFVMAVAAAEVAIGLGIIVSIFRSRETIDIDEVNLLKL
jgi:NADH-quinone oxidoreductase subunit K